MSKRFELTMSVYQQHTDMCEDAPALLEELVGCEPGQAQEILVRSRKAE